MEFGEIEGNSRERKELQLSVHYKILKMISKQNYNYIYIYIYVRYGSSSQFCPHMDHQEFPITIKD